MNMLKMVGLHFKNPSKMLLTMHTGNMDALEILSTLTETDIFLNNSLLVCVVKVLQRGRW